MNVPDHLVNEMLRALPSSQRQTVLSTLNGTNTHEVYCDSKQCKGRFVGHMQNLNGEKRFEPYRDNEGKMYIRSWRPRMDGQIGFWCWCGNDSRISKHEEGEFDRQGNLPSKAGFERIFTRLHQNPPNYQELNGVTKVDGFRLVAI